MKNVHLLPTEKPSTGYILGKCIKKLSDVKIGQFVKTHYMMFDKEYFQPQNIYITSDEEIKEGDWFITKTNDVLKVQKPEKSYDPIGKKIILTTDQDLIADGVQVIDDTFLQWFVNNQSCESVQVEKVEGRYVDYRGNVHTPISYEIIIPQEEPKQEMAGKAFYESADKVIVVKRQERLKDIELEEVFGSSHCQFSVIENNLAKLYRNQEKILKAIKLLRNDD
jgi:hypothetical protein